MKAPFYCVVIEALMISSINLYMRIYFIFNGQKFTFIFTHFPSFQFVSIYFLWAFIMSIYVETFIRISSKDSRNLLVIYIHNDLAYQIKYVYTIQPTLSRLRI